MNLKQKEMQAKLEAIKNKKTNFPVKEDPQAGKMKATRENHKSRQVANRGRSGSN